VPYIVEVLTKVSTARTTKWVHFTHHAQRQPAIAAASYEAAKKTYVRARLRLGNGRILADSARPCIRQERSIRWPSRCPENK
jgi:hypothetical protein